MKNAVSLIVLSFALTSSAVIPQSGDIVQIGDFDFVVLSKSDFERWKLTVDDLKAKWETMNRNEAGRAALHGRVKHTTVTNGVVQIDYADGYCYIEQAKSNAVKRLVAPEKKSDSPKNAFELRRAAIMQRRREAKTKTNEVTVVVGGGK